MREPPGYETEGGGQCLLLKRALYGAKQSGHLWRKELDGWLRRYGFEPTIHDDCVYVLRDAQSGITMMVGVWVDDIVETEKKIEAAGGKYFQGRPDEDAPDTFYEMKFRDPHGVIIDCTHLGWGGSVKDVLPADEADREKLEKRAAKKAAAQAAE